MISAFLVAGVLVAGACGDDAPKTAKLADLESYKKAADAAGHDPGAGSAGDLVRVARAFVGAGQASGAGDCV